MTFLSRISVLVGKLMIGTVIARLGCIDRVSWSVAMRPSGEVAKSWWSFDWSEDIGKITVHARGGVERVMGEHGVAYERVACMHGVLQLGYAHGCLVGLWGRTGGACARSRFCMCA